MKYECKKENKITTREVRRGKDSTKEYPVYNLNMSITTLNRKKLQF